MQLKGFLIHGLTVFLALLFMLHGYQPVGVLLSATLIAFGHISIDFLKCCFTNRKQPKHDLAGFLVDQGLHLLLIIMIWQLVGLRFNPAVGNFYGLLLLPKTLAVFKANLTPEVKFSLNHLLSAAIVYVYITFGGAFFIRKLLDWIGKSGPASEGQAIEFARTGHFIGILERFLILTLVINNALTAVAFVFTAKSIARFSELNNRQFAEYYLIGTLLSTAIAISGGFVLNYLYLIIN